jgi:serine/threonine protein kinase
MSMKCPNCDVDNPSYAKVCKACGALLRLQNEISTLPTMTLESPAIDLSVGSIVAGGYELLEKLGEGGMGAVFMAEQIKPVQRRVALKIIKLGMDTKQVVARFETDRRALALMGHPNIARIYDGGATEAGRPYFV